MIKLLKRLLIPGVGILFLITSSFSQVEVTGYCQYKLNLSFPNEGNIHPEVALAAASYPDEWKPFFGPILQQQNGLGFGGRIAFYITSFLGIEGNIEYNMAKLNFPEEEATDLRDRIESSSYTINFSMNDSGGSIMRYYGNVILNVFSVGRASTYLTAGLGVTRFSAKKGSGPEISSEISARDYLLHLHYENTSALTFNGGLGVKFNFAPDSGFRILSPHAGFRADIRIFYCKPEFKQMYYYKSFGEVNFDYENSYTQTASLIDFTVNIGYFIKF